MNDTERMGVGLIGSGRVGTAIASALRAAGHGIVAVSAHCPDCDARAAEALPGVPVTSRRAVVERAQLVLIAVPDGALAGLVEDIAQNERWQMGQLVVHTAGRYGLDVLRPAAEQGAFPLAIHPAMTFTGTSLDIARLAGAPFAITAPPLMEPVAQALVMELGGEPVAVADADRPLYHAALSHGANHLVTLIDQAMVLLAQAGITDPAPFLAPLTRAALDNVLNLGPQALTGPVARGDGETIAAHRRAIAGDPGANPEVLATYDQLMRATTTLATRLGRIDDATAVGLRALAQHGEENA